MLYVAATVGSGFTPETPARRKHQVESPARRRRFAAVAPAQLIALVVWSWFKFVNWNRGVPQRGARGGFDEPATRRCNFVSPQQAAG